MANNLFGKINWGVRLKDKTFVVGMTGLLFLLAKQILAVFGFDFDFTVINEQITNIINTVFVILFMLGLVQDPTTEGFLDSERALGYTEKGK
ncbi:phage holin [Vagococcus fluvialis]|uniref:phage holin n=1 Tax=Vagococcus fluvialis TaxID=2738 RepID=UPI001D0B5CFB|nr:phage holin [Vagococcus fluvialis]UDM72719.1 phage holin [Vagococcus fluvialis]UDM78441.1 phage holin [Vagococcus fluvialis]UDM83994.1 phage holin [Vagococcus fluvialis]